MKVLRTESRYRVMSPAAFISISLCVFLFSAGLSKAESADSSLAECVISLHLEELRATNTSLKDTDCPSLIAKNERESEFMRFYDKIANGFGWTKYLEYTYPGVICTATSRAREASFDLSRFSREEIVAIMAYSGGMYSVVNPKLYSGDPSAMKEIAPFINVLDSALKKLPRFKGKLYRKANLPEDVLDQHRTGRVVRYDGYTSTTHDSRWFTPEFNGGNPPRVAIFVDQSVSGRDLSGIQFLPGEREVLFPRGTKFRVVSRKEEVLPGYSKKSIVIHMVEASD